MKSNTKSSTIDMKLLPVKGTYFFTYAAYASLYIYMSVYMKHLGITAWETSIICGTLRFVGALFQFPAGVLADKLHNHRRMLALCCITSGIVLGCLMFVPEVSAGSTSATYVPVVCDVNGCFATICPKHATASHPGGSDICDDCAQTSFVRDITTRSYIFNDSACLWSCISDKNGGSRRHTNICCSQTINTTSSHRCYTISKTNKTSSLHNLTQIEFRVTKLIYTSFGKNTSNGCSRYQLSSIHMNGSKHASLTCNIPTIFQCATNCTIKDAQFHHANVKYRKTETSGLMFWMFTGIYLLGDITFSPILNLVDAMAYAILGKERHKWGKQRLWGSVGLATIAPFAGFLVDVASRHTTKTDYTPMFVLFAVIQLFSAATATKFPVPNDVTCSSPISAEMKILLKRPNVVCHFLFVFILGIYFGIAETFLFWHIKTVGEPPQVLFGLCVFISCLSEVVVLFAAGWIIRKIGHVNCLSLTCAVYAGRFLLYSQLRDPWMVLFIQPLAGITFGMYSAAATSYGSMLTPPGLHGTMQSIIGALHFCIGAGVGTLEGGPLVEMVGTSEMFRYHALSALGATALYFLAQKCYIERAKMAPADYNVVNTDATRVTLEMAVTKVSHVLPES